jgi:hypothetical protein
VTGVQTCALPISQDDARAIEKWLASSKTTRDEWVALRYEQSHKRGHST